MVICVFDDATEVGEAEHEIELFGKKSFFHPASRCFPCTVWSCSSSRPRSSWTRPHLHETHYADTNACPASVEIQFSFQPAHEPLVFPLFLDQHFANPVYLATGESATKVR